MSTEADRLEDMRRELRRLKDLADRAVAQVDDGGFFAAKAAQDNSLAIVVKHVAGNMLSRWTDFLTTDGEKPDRNRDSEFVIERADTREALWARWEAGWTLLFAAVDPLEASDLSRTVTIRGEPLSVWQAVLRQLSHYAYHVGQIVTLARAQAGDDWVSLSVPRGGSKAFNENPTPDISEG